ncbi:MAG: M20 family metallopeptidase [Acidimicrobiia bacterium]
MAFDTLLEEAQDLMAEAVRLRRTLHRRPEIGLDLPFTQEQVLDRIDGLGLEITVHERTSGVAALLTGGRPGPTILLRGDMDALEMPEDTDVEFESEVDGAMHACGHDTHVAMLAGAAKLLSGRKADLAGRVLFMFQPGEEGHHGARYMLEEGLLALPPLADGTPSPVTAAFAIHTTSSLPTGFISTKAGSIMASADTLRITVTGKGGHASEPYRAIDPIPIACEIVQAMQTMVTRRINIFDPGVVTVGRITAGTTTNVIPETAEIAGTIRAVSESTRRKVHDGIRRVAEGIAAAHEASVEVEIEAGYPVTVNSNDFTSFAARVADELVGADHVIRMPNPVMGAEDFSYVLQQVPGSMVFLGATPHDRNPATAAPNHSNRVFYDEACMATGIALHTAIAIEHLGVG